MAEPKMLTAIGLDFHQAEMDRVFETRRVTADDEKHMRAINEHIAALEAALSAAHAAIRAGDKLAAPTVGVNGMTKWCPGCDATWQSKEHHEAFCPVPAWRTARAAVKLEGEP